MRRNTAVFTAVAALAAVTVAMMLAARHQTSPASDPGIAAALPPPPVEVESPAVEQEPAPVAEHLPRNLVLCDGCLAERAVLDVAETYLWHLDPVYLQGEIWAHPLADIAPETPGLVDGQPKLPPGLLGAPEDSPFGMSIDTRDYPVATTWIVWVQTGWTSYQAIENEIWAGTLPEVARSWPPIKKEVYVAVDALTGEIWPSGIFHQTSSLGIQPPYPAHYNAVLEATHERVARWLKGGGSELSNPPVD